jgi:hypothetical protein
MIIIHTEMTSYDDNIHTRDNIHTHEGENRDKPSFDQAAAMELPAANDGATSAMKRAISSLT